MAITLQNAYDNLERDLEFSTDIGNVGGADSDLFISWGNAVDGAFYREMAKADPGRWITDTNMDLTTSTRSFAISDLYSLKANGAYVFYTDEDNIVTDQKLLKTNKGSSRFGWYEEGGTIYFTPANTNSGITAGRYVLRYIPKRTILSSSTDSLTIPDEYEDYVLKAFKKVYLIWNNNKSGALNITDSLFRDLFFDVRGTINPDYDNPDFNSTLSAY